MLDNVNFRLKLQTFCACQGVSEVKDEGRLFLDNEGIDEFLSWANTSILNYKPITIIKEIALASIKQYTFTESRNQSILSFILERVELLLSRNMIANLMGMAIKHEERLCRVILSRFCELFSDDRYAKDKMLRLRVDKEITYLAACITSESPSIDFLIDVYKENLNNVFLTKVIDCFFTYTLIQKKLSKEQIETYQRLSMFGYKPKEIPLQVLNFKDSELLNAIWSMAGEETRTAFLKKMGQSQSGLYALNVFESDDLYKWVKKRNNPEVVERLVNITVQEMRRGISGILKKADKIFLSRKDKSQLIQTLLVNTTFRKSMLFDVKTSDLKNIQISDIPAQKEMIDKLLSRFTHVSNRILKDYNQPSRATLYMHLITRNYSSFVKCCDELERHAEELSQLLQIAIMLRERDIASYLFHNLKDSGKISLKYFARYHFQFEKLEQQHIKSIFESIEDKKHPFRLTKSYSVSALIQEMFTFYGPTNTLQVVPSSHHELCLRLMSSA